MFNYHRLGSVICFYNVLSLAALADDVYLVDNTQGPVRRFDGIGGLSGGGATSKLLVNYPQEQRDQILDYLFKPLYGASLQILKVEIGGDAQSTDGTEASHMHNSWDENYNRGYEWWLMKEAKKRNPDILLYCLPWAFPAWVGDGTRSPYTNPERTADYVVRFILGARKYHNLTMNYVGIWNERSYNAKYIKVLRQRLDSEGLQEVQIVAADGFWEPLSAELLVDQELAKAVDIIGVHYPGTKGSESAFKTGKQLWSSEDYSTFNDEVGGGCWARILNQNYVNGNMTSTISWNLIASYYESLPFTRDGLMTADQPWSGYYRVETPIWITAHHTRFVYPGWYYFPHGAGVSLLKKGGSMVAFSSFDNIQFTIVIETMSHNHSKCIRPALPEYTVEPQNLSLNLNGRFSWVFKVDVWYSKFQFNGEPSTMLKKLGSIPVTNGTIKLSVGVDEVYTLTTMEADEQHDYPPIPTSKPFPLPYQDDFESYMVSSEPYNLAQQTGAYEVTMATERHVNHGKVTQQVVLEYPCAWCEADIGNNSLNIIGDPSWSDIYIQADTHIGPVNGTSGVFVAARVNHGGCDSFRAEGVFFFLFPSKGYMEVTGDLARTQKLLQKNVTVSPHSWNRLVLLIKDGYMCGTLNDQLVFNNSMSSRAPASGFVALGTAEYGLAEFDNLKIMGSQDGERWIQGRQPISNYAYGPSFDKQPILDDRKIDRSGIVSPHKDDTLYFKSSKHDKEID